MALKLSVFPRKRKVLDVYVSVHGCETGIFGRFDPRHTHRVSPDLIRTIQSLELITFLCWTGYQDLAPSPTIRQDHQPSRVLEWNVPSHGGVLEWNVPSHGGATQWNVPSHSGFYDNFTGTQYSEDSYWRVDDEDEDEEERAKRKMEFLRRALKALVIGAGVLFLASCCYRLFEPSSPPGAVWRPVWGGVGGRLWAKSGQIHRSTHVMLDYVF